MLELLSLGLLIMVCCSFFCRNASWVFTTNLWVLISEIFTRRSPPKGIRQRVINLCVVIMFYRLGVSGHYHLHQMSFILGSHRIRDYISSTPFTVHPHTAHLEQRLGCRLIKFFRLLLTGYTV